ncbi:tRNA (N(6)-L-threonylcarbamoyladenosine(37)-C(2))-methylthiotransferase MtaB [Desulfotalea psychrophila]|uniref:tRNA (N(6)-L-threonylcarbamoyladenosine(37)-C(2))-methylthiotransferase n=1 Tax=Desulfotalea psychrophila (strain LSv54 / DSM 12343) TaxID=177439 RepID=Q6AIZ5_DESPS|nr:tRNA (N(6)-L-threonylcarbamoyladenosine(37)-C(2))-methylthiotransferase MtaB [Desulfotalea psychrophila]CAG37685.1 conserved hypothetical protein [Desulfotalea psychrophila LSv54]
MKRISITTLGCKVNQFESASFSDNLSQTGYKIVGHNEEADYIIINTCTVTAAASAQSRHSIRHALRLSPTAKIIITGCYVEIGAEEIQAIEELRGREYHIIGNSCKDQVVDTIRSTGAEQLILGDIRKAKEICRLPVRHFGDRTRTYLRIQDGCQSFCTYCIVPFTRGPSRSLPLDEVIAQTRAFAEEGYQETVLTGIHIGEWGHDLKGGETFTDLLDRLSAEVPQMRFRISSLEPTEINARILELIKTRANIFPHLHIPLQSGSDQILARMNRHYDTARFAGIIEACHQAIPNLCIGIDVLAGFPGESEEHFASAYSFLQKLDFTYLHVFPYSIRPGTKAAEFTDQVASDIKAIRVKKLRALSDTKKSAFYQKQIGKTLPVQVEGKRAKDGLLRGYTDNYTLVHFAGADDLVRSSVDITLLENRDEYVYGKLV